MVLWRKGIETFVSYRIPLSITRTILPSHKAGMAIKPSSVTIPSSERALHGSSKRSFDGQEKYDELSDLLSDSDGWEEDLPIKPVEAGNQNQVKNLHGNLNKIGNEFSDADDSIICEILQSGNTVKPKTEKNLAGATTKSVRKPPARSSFSSIISEELRKPLVESTQQGSLYSSEDSRLLLSLLRGDNSCRQGQEDIQQGSEPNVKPESIGTAQKVGIADTSPENRHGVMQDARVNKKQVEVIQATGSERKTVQRLDVAIKQENKQSEILADICEVASGPVKAEDTSNNKFVGEPEPLASDPAAAKNISNHFLSNNEDCSKSYQDQRSLEMIKDRKRVQYAEKFTLLTQRQGIQDTQEIENRLKRNPKGKVIVPVRLSKEQEDVIRLAEAGHNIFYTGSAGTGKSVLLREMIKVLKDIYGHEQVAVTASTGLAACNIGGITLHSFAGVGLGAGEVTKIYRKVRRSRKHVKRWESVSALVIDEISMLDGELLDKLDFIAQKIRKNHKPFGDIQLIFCGDFFQLPPVTKDPNNSTKFAFESNVWRDGIDITIVLTKVFRQQGDSKFIEMLNRMRLGQIDPETEREFKKLSRSLPQDEIIPAELYSTRNEVERANYQRLNRLPGKAHVFHAIDGGVLEDREMKEKLLQNFLAPKELQLKIGAQVMMIKNIDATLVNGSLGKVIDFIDPETYMFYETILRNPDLSPGALAKLKDNPDLLRETWNQFCEEDDGDTPVRQKSVKEAFCKGDPDESVAQLGESIFDFLKDASSDDIETRNNLDRKRELLRQVHESSKGKKKLPLVRFKTSDMSTRTILVEPESWAIEDENEKSLVSRVQLPLMLAWSLSIHKSQGQTLPKVKVDLRRVFEKGQAYVALSRAVSREGLQVLNFDKSRIKAHQKVVDFYSTLVTVDHAIKQLQAQAGTAERHKKRKVDTRSATAAGQRRTRQLKPGFKASSKTTGPPSGIATMLMHRVQAKPPNDKQAVDSGECVVTFRDRGTSAYTREA